MITKLCPIDDGSLKEAAEILKGGGVVGMPTETVYGLAASAFDQEAVKSIFAAKGRPGDNPLIVHICREADLYRLIRGEITREQRMLMDAFWPGPMTLIFDKSDRVCPAVTAGLDTVAVRMPSRARFGCPAPQFCPTKVVEAMLMLCTGMSAKASILLYTPNPAMQAEPK